MFKVGDVIVNDKLHPGIHYTVTVIAKYTGHVLQMERHTDCKTIIMHRGIEKDFRKVK